MENETKTKREVHLDRVTLQSESIQKIDQLREHLKDHIKGVTLSRSEIVNSIIQFHAANLSQDEIDILRNIHFDEVKYTSWVLAQIKTAKARGESISLSPFFKDSQ
jgi:hypothetical protein